MAIKPVRVVYTSRNFLTGLSDVRAEIFKHNGVQFVSAMSNVVLSEIDAVNMPGLYVLNLSVSDINTMGGLGTYIIKMNSASKNAPATFKLEVLANNNDDIESHLTTIEGKVDSLISGQSSIASELATVKTLSQSTNNTIIDPLVGNANLKALIEQAISAVQSVQNNTSFIASVSPQMIVMGSGANTYKIPIRVYNTNGSLEDPDLQKVYVSIKNEAGLDRTNYVVGFLGGPVEATRISTGIYEADISIPDTASLEQLIFDFTYTENSNTLNFVRTSELVEEAQATGLALQTTLLDVLTDTSDIAPRVIDIQAKINDPVSGTSALKALIDLVKGVCDNSYAELVDSLHGLAVIKSVLDTKSNQASVDALISGLASTQGVGYDPATDSQKAVSNRTFFGGTAV